jgi:SAM-dependent methyltransferase
MTSKRKLLHVGCGMQNIDHLPACFRDGRWHEVRLDINPAVTPDVIGNITDMSAVADGSMDGIWSAHNLEHLHSFDVPVALTEFRRVLRPEGFAIITVPDLQAIAVHIVKDHIEQPLYTAGAGPITPLDVVFGYQLAIKSGNNYMAHRTGFSARTLGKALVNAGFAEVRVHQGRKWDLWALATMEDCDSAIYDELSAVLK